MEEKIKVLILEDLLSNAELTDREVKDVFKALVDSFEPHFTEMPAIL